MNVIHVSEMMLKSLSLRGLRVFEAAVRYGSFQRAAEDLHLTPSAVSHQIRALEDALGRPLFIRGSRRILPTTEAQAFQAEIREALRVIDHAAQRLTGVEKRAVLTVHSTPSFAFQTLLPRLPDFVAAYPQIDLRFSASQDAADLGREPVDIDVRYSRHPQPTEGSVTVLQETVSPLVSPSLIERMGPIAGPWDLTRFPRVHSTHCLVQWPDWQSRAGIRFDSEPTVRFDRSFMSIAAACDGMGVALESDLLADRELARGQLIAPLPATGLRFSGHRIVVRSIRAAAPEVQAFLDFVWQVVPAAASPTALG